MVHDSPTPTKVPFPYLTAKGIVPLGTFGGKMRIVEDLGFVGLKGDVNYDENVNVIDIIALVSMILDGTLGNVSLDQSGNSIL